MDKANNTDSISPVNGIKLQRRIGIIVLVAASLAIAFGMYWYKKPTVSQQISSATDIRVYEESRDLPFILDMFDKNWFWLVAQTREEYDPNFDFKHLTWSANPYNFGKLQVRVYYADNQPAGFIAYYKKNFYEGHVWYIAVKEEYRKKGYAKQLLQYAIQDLFNQGCQIVTLLTRLINTPARTTYTRLGFVETRHDDTFIYYALRKKEYPKN